MSSKYVGLMRLVNGDEPKEIASDCDVSYATVLRWKGELNKAQENNKVNALLSLEQGALNALAADAVTDLPVIVQESAMEAVNSVIEGVVGLKRLEDDLQLTASKINTRIRVMCNTAESIGDIAELTEAVCKLQNAFFGKGTQINIQNNLNAAGGDNYGAYISDAPGTE